MSEIDATIRQVLIRYDAVWGGADPNSEKQRDWQNQIVSVLSHAFEAAQPAPAPVPDGSDPIMSTAEWAALSAESRHKINVRLQGIGEYVANAENLARLVLNLFPDPEKSALLKHPDLEQAIEMRRLALLLTEGGG